jgi:deazaflavin-dependent oxidoreductase (nitroreductase family)
MSQTQQLHDALERGGLIDITTTGRTSGQPRRVEIVFFNIDGRVYISGMPGRRDWIANLQADPHLLFHFKREFAADLPATARVITDETERREVMERVTTAWKRQDQLEAFVAGAPLIEVTFDEGSLLAA